MTRIWNGKEKDDLENHLFIYFTEGLASSKCKLFDHQKLIHIRLSS